MNYEPLSLGILLNIFFLWVIIFLFDFKNFLTFLTESKRSPTRLLQNYLKRMEDRERLISYACTRFSPLLGASLTLD